MLEGGGQQSGGQRPGWAQKSVNFVVSRKFQKNVKTASPRFSIAILRPDSEST